MRIGLPFRALVIETDRSPDALVERLEGDLDPDRGGGLLRPAGHRPWLGAVSRTGLEMRRRTPFRSSFQPVIRARFEPTTSGARVHVSMSLMIVTRLVLAGWALATGAAVAGLLTTHQPVLLLVPAMCLGVLLLGSIAFHHEADVAERYLRERIG